LSHKRGYAIHPASYTVWQARKSLNAEPALALVENQCHTGDASATLLLRLDLHGLRLGARGFGDGDFQHSVGALCNEAIGVDA
jgi:hypothetical protein